MHHQRINYAWQRKSEKKKFMFQNVYSLFGIVQIYTIEQMSFCEAPSVFFLLL